MSAREMFEKLGYKYTMYGNDIEFYKQFEYAKVKIYFADFVKTIEISSDKDITFTIDIEELQAINQQVRELGWLDE